MSQYMLLVYEEELEPAEQAERELVELHRSLREAGRPVAPADEWLRMAREAGADVSGVAVEDLS